MPSRWPESYVALTLLAALLFAVGNSLQKLAVAGRVGPLPAAAWLERGRRIFAALLRSPVWMLGLALSIAAFAMEIQALAQGDDCPGFRNPADGLLAGTSQPRRAADRSRGDGRRRPPRRNSAA